MFWSAELITTESIVLLSMALFVYWVMRALLILAGSKDEINDTLDTDLRWGRRVWLFLRMLFHPSSQLLAI
jgi:hypothetical protein